ncbi:MAG: RNA-binding S4 domain-containing protein [Proteobacteria bacterium]|nr:RNA-binding S4 domain-containing protein [Desulfobulbaceae bacterium]MCP4296878.1 RNA-binding S4 domain-containing protein [Pseudomonadota bacterium]
MKSIVVKDLPIRLGQFLKFADLVQDGFEAKIRIQEGEVMVNGEVETRRGKQLSENDVVSYANTSFTVCSSQPNPNK